MSSCFGCSKAFNHGDEKIACSLCSNKFHLICANMTPNDKKSLKEIASKWVCQYCSKSRRGRNASQVSAGPSCPTPAVGQGSSDDAPLTMRHFKELMAKLDCLTTNIVTIKDDVNSIRVTQELLSRQVAECTSNIERNRVMLERHDSQLLHCENNISSMSSTLNDLNDDMADIRSRTNEALARVDTGREGLDSSEILDRVRRSHNVILRRLPESQDGLSDDGAVHNIVNHIFSPGTGHIVSHNRIGRKTGQTPRPLLIKFSNPVTPLTILRNKKLLSTSSAFGGVTISDDVTPYQSSCLRKAREELKSRLSCGEADLTIKYVRGVPTVVRAEGMSGQKN